MKTQQEPTRVIRIYLSGPIEVAKQIIREHCLSEGLCVTIEPTLFIYTGGEESGYVVGLLNYPRFPTDAENLDNKAQNLAIKLLHGTCQHSVLVVTPEQSFWHTKRD
jgi:hypothetical protein